MSAPIEVTISCERCDNSVHCSIVNPARCKSSYVASVNTNFNMSKEYKDPSAIYTPPQFVEFMQ